MSTLPDLSFHQNQEYNQPSEVEQPVDDYYQEQAEQISALSEGYQNQASALNDLSEYAKRLKQENDNYVLDKFNSTIEKEKQSLANIDDHCDRLRDIMVEAKDKNDNVSYVKAQDILTQLNIQKNDLKKDVQNKESRLNEYISTVESQHEENDSGDDLSSSIQNDNQQTFLSISHPLELKSDAYAEWIRNERPEINPKSDYFDRGQAIRIAAIKNDLIDYCYRTKQPDLIATPYFYQTIDETLERQNQDFLGVNDMSRNNNYNPNSFGNTPSYMPQSPISPYDPSGRYMPQEDFSLLNDEDMQIIEKLGLKDRVGGVETTKSFEETAAIYARKKREMLENQ